MERRYNVAKKVLVAVYSASGVTRRVGVLSSCRHGSI